jgi:signal transduction histidine kinase
MKQPHHSPFSLFLNFFHHAESSQKLVVSELNSSIVHELKTPLNAIVSYSEILQQDLASSFDKNDCLNYVKEISEAALDLSELVNDLLDVSAINSGNFLVNLNQEIDVADVINRSIRLNYAYALRRHIKIESEISELRPIKLDAKRTKQIITNLLSNAIKYSPKQTIIRIKAYLENNSLVIKIIDQGFGMSENQIAKAFDKYQTFANPNSHKVDSFGLGLAIVKELVERQKGRIEIRSKLDEGTQIELRFSC